MQPGLLRFFGLGLSGYLIWYLLYQYFLKDSTAVDEWLIHSIVLSVEAFLRLMGYGLYEVVSDGFRWQLGIANSPGLLEVGAPCDGLVLFVLFAIFVLAFPGKGRRKLWFIPLGIAAIHMANLLRVLCLVLINFYWPEALAFNHDYTWTILIYGFIFWLWYLWTEKYSHPGNAQRA